MDTGTGMDAATLARVTEPFFTTKVAGKGTGLGLAMARGFAEQSGGGLAVVSAPGQGTAVTLWLPQAATGVSTTAAGDEADIVGAGGYARVLLVDDEMLVCETLAMQLEDAGFDVLAADSGAEAMAFLDAGEAADVVVTDLSMPGMDGLAAIKGAQHRRPGLPAVLLTGHAGDDTTLAVGGAVSGTFTLLLKPVTAAQLAERVKGLLATGSRHAEDRPALVDGPRPAAAAA